LGIGRLEVEEYISDHPGCNRPALFEHFAGDRKGKERRKIVLSISNNLIALTGQGRVIETDIKRQAGSRVILDSKLTVRQDNSKLDSFGAQPTDHSHAQIEKRREKAVSQHNRTFDLDSVDLSILSCMNMTARPVNPLDLSKAMDQSGTTIYRRLSTLQDSGLVVRTPQKKWALTTRGVQEARRMTPLRDLYAANPEDNFFFNIPMLIESAGEQISSAQIAHRASGYQGFYEKFGLEESKAQDDFKRKIDKHLESETLRGSFLQQLPFIWQVTTDEDQLFLWRLYSMLHTVLLKSSQKRKLGMAIWLYDPLLALLRRTWGSLLSKTEGLTPSEKYAVLLMANGVQLETILPSSSAGEFREKLEALGLSIRIYNPGTKNEFTLMETGANWSQSEEKKTREQSEGP
jgi:hypothetical protein